MAMKSFLPMAGALVGVLALAAPSLAGSPLAELPLTFRKGLPLASILVDGAPVFVVLDSGAVGFVLDDRRAARLGIAADHSTLSMGTGGIARVGLAHGVRLDVAGLEIAPEHTVLAPLGNIGVKADGVLGLPLFGQYVVEIDYAARLARIFAPRGYQPWPGAEVLPVWTTYGPTVRGRLNLMGGKDIEADFHVDTGSSHVLTLCKPFVDRLGLLQKVPGLTPGQTSGVGGRSLDRVGRIEKVALGRFSVERPEVRFSTQADGVLATERFAANLGNGFLSRYVVTFDLPHGRLILRKAGPSPREAPDCWCSPDGAAPQEQVEV